MLPEPLHPAVVHFPIALTFLGLLFATCCAVAIHAGRLERSSWWVVIGLLALLVASGWLAIETGEHEEETVETVVAERHIERHEEAAERLLVCAGLALAFAALGLAGGTTGALARVVTVGLSFATVAAAVSTGHSGGELIYRHGAARAYGAGDAVPSLQQDGDHDVEDPRVGASSRRAEGVQGS